MDLHCFIGLCLVTVLVFGFINIKIQNTTVHPKICSGRFLEKEKYSFEVEKVGGPGTISMIIFFLQKMSCP